MLDWKFLLCALMLAAAHGSVGLALVHAFRGRRAAFLGRRRWALLAALAGEVVLQGIIIFALYRRSAVFAQNLAVAACGLELAIGIGVWPALAGIDRRLGRAIGGRGRLNLARAHAGASEALAWLEMASEVVRFGQWRLAAGSTRFEWSEEMFRIHGLTADAFTPTADGALALLHADDQTTLKLSLETVQAQGGGFEVRLRLRRPNTELRHVIMRGAAQPHGAIIGVLLDVTEQKAAEARMREANAVALQANAALREMTLEDGLTGLSNRRQFDLSLVHEFKRAVRSNKSLSLLLIDLDHFRSYNDHYGTPAGDAVLRRVAQMLKSMPRRTGDIVARYAGAQIAVLLPLADASGAAHVASQMMAGVQKLQIPHEGNETGYLTASCGAASFIDVADLNNPLELVRRADLALYKQDGRGGIAVFDPLLNADLPMPYQPAATNLEHLSKTRG
jgi:diguanylate cyclase (GGDEF)-like protein